MSMDSRRAARIVMELRGEADDYRKAAGQARVKLVREFLLKRADEIEEKAANLATPHQERAE